MYPQTDRKHDALLILLLHCPCICLYLLLKYLYIKAVYGKPLRFPYYCYVRNGAACSAAGSHCSMGLRRTAYRHECLYRAGAPLFKFYTEVRNENWKPAKATASCRIQLLSLSRRLILLERKGCVILFRVSA